MAGKPNDHKSHFFHRIWMKTFHGQKSEEFLNSIFSQNYSTDAQSFQHCKITTKSIWSNQKSKYRSIGSEAKKICPSECWNASSDSHDASSSLLFLNDTDHIASSTHELVATLTLDKQSSISGVQGDPLHFATFQPIPSIVFSAI